MDYDPGTEPARPQPEAFFESPRRRRPWVAAIAVLLVAALLAGVSVGYIVWGPGLQAGLGLSGGAGAGAGSGLPYDSAAGVPGDDSGWYADPDAGDPSSPASGSDVAVGVGDVSSVVAAVAPAVVNIDVELAYGRGQSAGTGIVLTSSGEVLTNNHVIEGASGIRVTSVGTGATYTAAVVGHDRTNDIALLQLEGASGLPTAELGDSKQVAAGDEIVVIGNAGGDGGEPTAADGTVSAVDRSIVVMGQAGAQRLRGLIEVAANVQTGQSGGPTVDAAGKVIGVTTAATVGFSYDQAGGQGYAVPISQAFAIVQQIRSGDSSGSIQVGPTAFLGVQIATSGPGGGWDGGGTTVGAVVAGVLPDTPAEKAGLQEGDLITSLGAEAVDSATGLTSAIARHSPGDRVEVVWVDQLGRQRSATVELIAGPAG
jgi:S1-C subfamily serine protease